MMVTFLGTGTSHGIPMIACDAPVCLSNDSRDKRLRSSVLISWDNFRYVIDCGPDFRQQMLRENIQSINGVLFAHEHSDHTAGIDDLRPFTYKMGKVPVYAQQRVVESLKRRFGYIFDSENRYAGAPKLAVKTIDSSSFTLGDVQVTPIEIMHGSLPITAYRFRDTAYITDLKTICDQEKKKLENLDTLIINALRVREHPSHLNLEEALTLVQEMKPKRTYLTHISHMLGFHADVQKSLPKNVFLSYDGLQIEL